jgi:hypothetical protein
MVSARVPIRRLRMVDPRASTWRQSVCGSADDELFQLLVDWRDGAGEEEVSKYLGLSRERGGGRGDLACDFPSSALLTSDFL